MTRGRDCCRASLLPGLARLRGFMLMLMLVLVLTLRDVSGSCRLVWTGVGVIVVVGVYELERTRV